MGCASFYIRCHYVVPLLAAGYLVPEYGTLAGPGAILSGWPALRMLCRAVKQPSPSLHLNPAQSLSSSNKFGGLGSYSFQAPAFWFPSIRAGERTVILTNSLQNS